MDSGGVLEVTVRLTTPTRVHFQLSNASPCPFAVRIFPDSSGQYMFVGFGSVTLPRTSCQSNTSTTDLAPGDSLSLSREFPAADLTRFTPGLYGINVTVASTTMVEGAWGGAVRLPLSSAP